MCKEARKLASLGDNAVIKIPMIEEGVKAVRTLSLEGIKTNVTLIFQPIQALIAAKAGATYVSPFIGRLDDISQKGMGKNAGKSQLIARAMAKSAAIKRGMPLKKEEMGAICQKLFACKMPEFSPNGKPAFFVLSFDELKKKFKT